MEQKMVYPDFFAWRKNAIRTKSGLIFAPEDLWVARRHVSLVVDGDSVGSES